VLWPANAQICLVLCWSSPRALSFNRRLYPLFVIALSSFPFSQTTPRCVGCDQWKGGKRWRGRAGCPIPPGWQRTLPQRDPPVDHSASTLICILCYKQWGHLKEAFREAGSVSSDGTLTSGSGLVSSKPLPISLGKRIGKKRHHSEQMADSGAESGDDYSMDSVEPGTPKSSSDSYSTWHNGPHSPTSQDLGDSYSDSPIYGSRPNSPSFGSSSPYSSSPVYIKASRKRTPCMSVVQSPVGSLTPSPLLNLLHLGISTSPSTQSLTRIIASKFNQDTITAPCQIAPTGDSLKKPKLAEV
jgi:hypothetical protein